VSDGEGKGIILLFVDEMELAGRFLYGYWEETCNPLVALRFL